MQDFSFAKAILEQTNGGLQIIKDYYNNVDETKSNNKFKIRDNEKTASASLKKVNGTWLVRDWGAWEKSKNAIGICMFEDNLTYPEACSKLAKLYNIEYKGVNYQSKPDFERREKKASEKNGNYYFKYNKNLSEEELKTIGVNVTNKIASKFKLKSCKSFTYIKEGKALTTIATKEYPIFVFDFGTWQKIYQPKTADKQYRFRYAGTRPKNYIFGLENVIKAYKKNKADLEENYDYLTEEKNFDPKLDNIIICSGDRDAINVASFGYNVVWLNSETANLDYDTYKLLTSMTTTLYNLPDIDSTGVKQAVKLALKYIDLKTIWLPDYLKLKRDFRGNKCKDLRDFVNHFYDHEKGNGVFYNLKKLVQNALPMKFWDEVETEKGIKYYFNIVNSHHFLKNSGFYRLEVENEKEDYCYIRITGNVVKRVTPNIIENFVNSFLRKKQMPIPIRNMVLKTPYLKEATLSKLPLINIDFTDTSFDKQYWFFKDYTLEIKANNLVTHKAGSIDKYVWDNKVINHSVTARDFIEKPHFKIFKDAHDNLDIEILEKNNKYLNYLINTSRIHWQKDLEGSFKNRPEKEELEYFKKNQFNISGANLNEDEILEQKLHLINKIYALGYMLHKHKDKSKAWFLFAMDNKLSDIGESHGGSGKSLSLEYLTTLLKRAYIHGRSKKLTSNDFIYERVTRDTEMLFIDDMNQYFDFQHFFSDITSSMIINPKNSSSFELSFADSPKLCGTSNFPPKELDPSTSRRILFMVFSDYYHFNNGDYKQTRQVSDDFDGKKLFDDFNTNDFNNVFNFWAQCIQFFLSHKEKVDPPMNNVTKRNLISEMGAAFNDWVYVYFSEESEKLNKLVSRPEAYIDFRKKTSSKMSNNKFKKSLIAFCKYNNYILNPKEYQNKDGRIIKNITDTYNKRISTEMLYIKTEKQPTEPTQKEDDELDF